MPYLNASAVVIHYEEALYQVYAPLPLPFTAATLTTEHVPLPQMCYHSRGELVRALSKGFRKQFGSTGPS